MSRRFVTIADDWTQPEEIWTYYERSIDAIAALGSPRVNPSPNFVGMTTTEFNDALVEMRNELDLQVSFALLASFEATLRVDFWDRVHRRLRSGPGAEFMDLAREHEHRVPFDAILDIWNKHSTPHGRAGELRAALQIRHWLGHGRYWVPKTKYAADPLELWNTAARAFAAFAGVPTLSPR
jgi:hypothetical protein